jgi:hypothetical protein
MEIAKHATWPELVRWSSEPTLLSVPRFGKDRERFDAVLYQPRVARALVVLGKIRRNQQSRRSADRGRHSRQPQILPSLANAKARRKHLRHGGPA